MLLKLHLITSCVDVKILENAKNIEKIWQVAQNKMLKQNVTNPKIRDVFQNTMTL